MNLKFSILINNTVSDNYEISNIYSDDTIENIKFKLSNEIENKNIKQYYFFYKRKKILNPYDLYNQLSVNDTILIDKKTFTIFCINHNIKILEDKPYYTLEDILQLNIEGEIVVNETIGIEEGNYIVNPFENIFNYQDNVSTTSNTLLLDYPEIETIYVCFAKNVLEYSQKQKLIIENVFNIYYPYLFQEKIFSNEQLVNEFLDEYNEYNKIIDLQHTIFNDAKDLHTPDKGLHSLYFVLYTKQPFVFPIDIFFKLLQSSAEYPYIKLNQGRKQENIFRLYAPYVSLSGNKAPYFDKSKLNRLKNIIKKIEVISYVIEFDKYQILIDIDTNGYLYYTISDLKMASLEDIEVIISDTINPLINRLIHFFDPSEKIFNKFIKLQDESIDIIDMKYKYLFPKVKTTVSKFVKCFSTIFNLIEEKEITKLRYKRVSSFNKLDSEQAYLIDLMNLQIPRDSIIHSFATSFNVTLEEATSKLQDIVYLYETKTSLSSRRILKSKNNPGFSVEISKTDKNVEVLVNNITHAGYIEHLDVYINNLILISQQSIKGDEIVGLCKKIDEVIVKDVDYKPEIKEKEEELPVDEVFDFDMNFGSNTMNVFTKEQPDYLSKLLNVADVEDDVEEKDEPEIKENDEESVKESEDEKSVDEESVKEEESDDEKSVDESEDEKSVDESEDEKSDEEEVELESEDEEEVEEKEQEDKPQESLLNESEVNPKPKVNNEVKNQEKTGWNDIVFDNSPNDTKGKKRGGAKTKGGALGEDRTLFFIYNNINQRKLNKILGRDISIKGAQIKGYFRAFGGNTCNIIPRKEGTCKGIIFYASEMDISKIMKELPGYKEIPIVVYDDQGNDSDGKTFELNTKSESTDMPTNEFLKEVYKTVSQGWPQVEGKKNLYIYNNDYQLMGLFDGEKQIEQSNIETTIINLGHPSPFLKKLQEREPSLFIKEDSQAFSQYSKLCPWNRRRYPIILTKKEKDEIDRVAPGSYHSAIEYGTNPDKPYFYICPQYWNLKTNKPMRKEDVDPTKIIGSKTTNPDLSKQYIFEFSTDEHGPHSVASFLDKKSHPKGHFIPCCFKLNKKGEIPLAQKKRIEEAAKLMAKIENKSMPKNNTNEDTEYIQNGLKFPLPNKRRGELTVSLESFFNFDHLTCYSNPKTKKFKLNKGCLLRRGVENNKEQSFIAVLAFIFNKSSIVEMKQHIVECVTIDNIQDFHNGALSHTFSKEKYADQDITPYLKSDLYLKMESNVEGFKKIANGLENFHKYLMDPTVVIDYTYLWDIICSGILKQNGKRINMIILNETMDDATQNINIICPTTKHSSFLFNLKRLSIIIYKRGDYYEPLVIYKEDSEKIYPDKHYFKLTEDIPFMETILESINKNLGECNGAIINKYYTFKQNITLIELKKELDKLPEYSIKTQIMGYDGKIIALIVTYNKDDKARSFYVPCAPSSKEELPYEVINDSHWKNYAVTVKYLKKLYIDSNKAIPCLPQFRVIDKSLIVGIITMTNQFVMLKNPEENKYHDELKDLDDHHYIHYTDKEYINYDYVLSSSKLTKEQDVIFYLKLEQQFYNAYFNTLKVAIGDIKNLSIRKKIEDVIKSDESYPEQITALNDIITPLLSMFQFVKFDKDILNNIIDVNLCKGEKTVYCTDDNILLLPITNLFTKENNESAYLSKFINNLLRNHNIQTSIFKETHSTIYYTDHYNLSETEILILESMLFNYMDSLGEIVKRNKYIEFRGFEDLTPNEIFQLIDSQPVEKENSEINLSYNTNSSKNSSKNSSASSKKVEHDLFGILPEQEVEQIIKPDNEPNVSLNNTPEDESPEEEGTQPGVNLNGTPEEIKHPNVKLNNTPENESTDESTQPSVNLNGTPEGESKHPNVKLNGRKSEESQPRSNGKKIFSKNNKPNEALKLEESESEARVLAMWDNI